jgi:hypothetical protein
MSPISDAVTYPTTHGGWKKTVLIGGVLSVFGFLFIPLLPVYGYIIRTIRHRLDGDPHPPMFDEWGALFSDGLKAFVIGFVYLLVPAIVAVVTFGGSIAAMASGTSSGGAAGIAGFAFGMLLTFVLTLVFGYVAVAAIVNFASEGRFGAAFDFAAIKAVALSRDHALAWGYSVLVFIAASIVVGLLNIIPLLGAIIGAFVFFYAQIVAAYLWASGYNDARDGAVTGRSDIGESAA